MVELLLDAGANINDRGGEKCGGLTPLIDAAGNGNFDVIKVLVKRGANLLAKDDQVLAGDLCSLVHLLWWVLLLPAVLLPMFARPVICRCSGS